MRAAHAQVYILDAIAKMPVQEAKDVESIVERVVPRLQHANSAVVLSAVKVGLQTCKLLLPATMSVYLGILHLC